MSFDATWIAQPFGPTPEAHRLLLGALPEPRDARRMAELGITDVIDCTKSGKSAWITESSRWPTRPSRFHCPMHKGAGVQSAAAVECMADAIRWGVDALRYPKNVLFVHCHSGRHRSASLVYGILRAGGWTADQALAALRFRQGVEPRYIAEAELALRRAFPKRA